MILPPHVAERYREPVALKDDAGAIRAWACPRCFRVSVSVSCGGKDGREREAEYSRERAMECGICRKCGKRCECGYQSQCDECRAKEYQQIKELREANRPEEERKAAEAEAHRSSVLAAMTHWEKVAVFIEDVLRWVDYEDRDDAEKDITALLELVGYRGNQASVSEASPSAQSEALKAHSQFDPQDAQEE